MIIPKGIKIRKNNKFYRDEIPDSLLSKKQLDLYCKKPVKSNNFFDDNKKENNKKEK